MRRILCPLRLFAACGLLWSTASFAKLQTNITPIIVAPTGHKSCRTDKWGRKDSPYSNSLKVEVDRVVAELKSQYESIEPRVIYSCFDYEKLIFGGKLHFKYTKENNEIGKVELGNWVLFERIDWSYIEPVVTELATYVNEVASQVENPQVYLIGHSWGAWLNMKLAEMLPPDLKIPGLVTLDPVSPLDCWPNLYLQLGPNYLKSCHQAPTDIGVEEQENIFNRVNENWRHFYQMQFIFLSSGPLEYLKDGIHSFHIKYKRDIWYYHHGAVQHEKQVWSFVKKLFADHL